MGSLLMVKIPDLEVRDICEDDFSMEKISQAMLKYILNNLIRVRERADDHDDTIDDLQNQINALATKVAKPVPNLNVKP